MSVRGWNGQPLIETKGQDISIKFSKTQLAMMRAAADREDRCFAPSPAMKSGAAKKVAAKLIAAELAREIKAKAEMPVWRRDAEGGAPFALKLTAAGLKLVAVAEETKQTIESEEPASPKAIFGSTSSENAALGSKPLDDAAPREGGKLASVVAMLRREEGATIDALTAATGWLPLSHAEPIKLTSGRRPGRLHQYHGTTLQLGIWPNGCSVRPTWIRRS